MSEQFLGSNPQVQVVAEFPEAVEVGVEPSRDCLLVSVRCRKGGISGISLTWRVRSEPSAICFQDAWERGYGDLGWFPVDEARSLPWFSTIVSAEGVRGFGVRTSTAVLAHWTVSSDRIVLHLDLRSGARPTHLGERTLRAVEVVQTVGKPNVDLHDFMHELCRRLCPCPRLAAFPVYGANDWYYAYGNNTRDRLIADSERVSRWSSNTENRPFSVIDAGWQPNGGCEGAPWDCGNSRFGDMPSLAERMREVGTRPGIWIRPLLTGEAVEERFLIAKGTLDPSLPENLERVSRDIARCHEWGFELIKHDFSTWDCTGLWGFEMQKGVFAPNRFFKDDTRTSAEIFSNLYATIRHAAGDSLLIGCNTFSHLAAGTHEIQRTGDDTSGKEWERTLKMGVNTLAFRTFQHDAFYAADADCVGLTKEIDWRLNRMWLDAVAKSGTPLFVSANHEAVGPDQESALRDAFEQASRRQQVAKPEDWLETLTPHRWKQGQSRSEYAWK